MGAPAACGVVGRLASDPSWTCGPWREGACNGDKSTLYSKKLGGGGGGA